MKARIPYSRIPYSKSQILAAKTVVSSMQNEFAQRFLKIMLMTLHEQEGFGKKRITEFYNVFDSAVDDMHKDPAYWDKVDRLLIDEYGLAFAREDYERMESIFYKGPEITEREANEAMKDYKTWLSIHQKEG